MDFLQPVLIRYISRLQKIKFSVDKTELMCGFIGKNSVCDLMLIFGIESKEAKPEDFR